MRALPRAWPVGCLVLLLALPTRSDANAALEGREQRLAYELRCVVCQNQTVAESNAPLAADMRREIRSQLQAGRSDAEVVAFFEQRYGSFVHYRPPLRPSTWLLWGAPFATGLGGLALLYWLLRRDHHMAPPVPLTAAQREHARCLLEQEDAS